MGIAVVHTSPPRRDPVARFPLVGHYRRDAPGGLR